MNPKTSFAWLARTILPVLLFASCAVAVSGDDAPQDDDPEGDMAAAGRRLNIAPAALVPTEFGETTFEGIIFGARGESATGARAWLDALLARKVDLVDRRSRLNDSQKRKLHLAGHGDIKRFFDRVEAQRAQILLLNRAALDEKTVAENFAATRRLRHVLDVGPFEEESLFAKTVKRSLTARQAGRAELLREVALAGGLVENGPDGVEEWYDIDLSETEFADAGLEHIQHLGGLRSLALCGTSVTDRGLAHVAKLNALQILDLSGTAITDAGLAHLKGMTSLRIAYFTGSQVTDAGLLHLRDCKNLEVLDLARTTVTDAGLAHLKGLARLRRLDLAGCKIADGGLASLSTLANLERITLNDTRITDSGLVQMQTLEKLQRLDIVGAAVSDAAVETLQRALPGLNVVR